MTTAVKEYLVHSRQSLRAYIGAHVYTHTHCHTHTHIPHTPIPHTYALTHTPTLTHKQNKNTAVLLSLYYHNCIGLAAYYLIGLLIPRKTH